MLFVPTEPTGIKPIKKIQIKVTRQIHKKQAKLFLPAHDFFRPKNHIASIEIVAPMQNTQTNGARTNIANI